MTVMIKLEVYISEDCWSCAESERIVADVIDHFPNINVQFLDMSTTQQPENVFATPTYRLNGRVISLGNPTREELYQKLLSEQQKAQA